jgi:formamidopyrimidine-DNA glycosylase
MPELPEVETITRQLRKVLVGQELKAIKISLARSFIGESQNLIHKEITNVKRLAKILIIEFEKDFPKLLIHLKMTGQLIYQFKNRNEKLKNKNPNRIVGGHPTNDWIANLPSKHTRVIFTFTDGSELFFNDQRTFGWIKVIKTQKEFEKETQNFNGVNPLLKSFDGKQIANLLGNSTRPIKIAIMDQKKISGIGNIYANDALFLAGILPTRTSKSLSENEWQKLSLSIQKVLKKGIKYGGASDSDYIHINGLGGSYQDHFLVYKKDGQKCSKCSGKIIKIKLGGRGTYFCQICQK